MASTGATAAGTWRYRRIVLAGLAISVVLNLFFVAGAAWTRMAPPPPARGVEQRYQRMAGELDLNAQQRGAFERYVVAMRSRSSRIQPQLNPLLAAAWEEAGKPQADPAQVLRLFDEAFDKRRQFQREALVQMLDFLATLSPEQRTKFIALTRVRRDRWRGSSAGSR